MFIMMMMMQKEAKSLQLIFCVVALLSTLKGGSANLNGTLSLSDCTFYDRDTSTCLHCSVAKSNYQEFYRNFKENVPEEKCQTHIGAYPRELVYDVNSQLFFASVLLETPNTLIQYTKKILFEIKYDCGSDNECEETEFFALNLSNLLPIHQPALKNFIILLPILSLRASVVNAVKVRSHSQDACHGRFSSFSFSTNELTARTLSAKPSSYCRHHSQIIVTPANSSSPLLEVMPSFKRVSLANKDRPITGNWTADSGSSKSGHRWSAVVFKCVIVVAGLAVLLSVVGFCYYSRRPQPVEVELPEIELNPRIDVIRPQIPLFHYPPHRRRWIKEKNHDYDSISGESSNSGAVASNGQDLYEQDVDDSRDDQGSVRGIQSGLNSGFALVQIPPADGEDYFYNPGVALGERNIQLQHGAVAGDGITYGSLISAEEMVVYGEMRNADVLERD